MDDNKEKIQNKSEIKEKSNFSKWFDSITREFKRISWPSKKDATKMTISVIITSAILGAIIVGYDFILAYLYGLLTNIFI